ncbi:MAG: hypothetical protein OXF25_07465 [Cyanobacteria bacterium MAG CAR3_bin_5]|nr:hypothetical protein [Cyanobacteria bacterium MAG CAR3_bin_5]
MGSPTQDPHPGEEIKPSPACGDWWGDRHATAGVCINFLCLVDFALELDETNVLLVSNDCGKTSVLRALSILQ